MQRLISTVGSIVAKCPSAAKLSPVSALCKPAHHRWFRTTAMAATPPISKGMCADLLKPFQIPDKTLLGPGPSNPPPEVLRAMGQSMLGHLHPEFVQVMKECSQGLRYMFQTKNQLTVAISGSGHAGMEAAMVNLLERGERVLIADNGHWGIRSADIAERVGADVKKISKPPGEAFTLSEIEKGLKEYKPACLFICHGESSSGVAQPLEGIGKLCHQNDCLLIVDTVASLGSLPVDCDALKIDLIYTGSQKVIGCPSGLAPISVGPRALKKLESRKTKVASYYMDLMLLGNYWGCFPEAPKYHHTGPISMVYALREALRIVVTEGLPETISRHKHCAGLLYAGLEKLGLKLYVKDPAVRLPSVTTVEVPAGVDFAAVVKHLMSKHSIEIAGGLGPTAGKVWRIGLMGYNCTEENVRRVISAMEEALAECQATPKL